MSATATTDIATGNKAADQPRSSRSRSALVILAVYWGVVGIVALIESPYFFRFLFGMAAPALLLIAYCIWWWLNRNFSLRERLLGFLLVVASPFAMARVLHSSLGMPHALMTSAPLVMTTWMLWSVYGRQLRQISWWPGAMVVLLATWGTQMVIRTDGLNGDLRPTVYWRWNQTAEEKFLAERKTAALSKPPAVPESAADSARVLTLSAGDWPAFRGGPSHDGVVRDISIATDWNTSPPPLKWKQKIGPAWSSVIIIGDRLFTQEQRGEQEAVVCYDAATGAQLWIHEDTTRFWESVSGAGPRGTPTFSDGRLYTFGGTGLLNCLDAATGKKYWSHDLKTEANAQIPMWGLSSSPLVANGLVVTYGGGEKQNNLIAYDAQSGKEAWRALAGSQTYSSPQLVTLAGEPQILILCDDGLVAVEPASGAVLWKGGAAMPGAPRNLQTHLISTDQLMAGTLTGFGVGMIDVAKDGDKWNVQERWASTEMKPEFSEFVLHDGHAYGFDGAIFACLDIATGKRKWKAGRYGRGQVVLLEQQGLLMVLSESGEVAILAADPKKHRELSRFQAITGKTWNHPVIAHGRLYVRNAEEMACYELPSP